MPADLSPSGLTPRSRAESGRAQPPPLHGRRSRGRRRSWAATLAGALLVGSSLTGLRVQAGTSELPNWVLGPPPQGTQRELSTEQRGINPCLTPDPGFRHYHPWSRAPIVGQMLVPKNLPAGRKTVDVVVHFHGHEAARKEFVRAVDDVVLVGIDLGTGSGAYLDKFSDPTLFERLLASVEDGVRAQTGNEQLRIGHVGITSWSAGYGAVLKILATDYGRQRVDAVALLDGLHTSYRPPSSLEAAKLEPVVQFAQRAQKNQKLLYVSHSSIVPPDYASTTETANYLVFRTGGRPSRNPAAGSFPLGLQLISSYQSGAFTVRGFSGNGRLDHCAQFGVLGPVVRGRFLPRWR